MTDPGIGTYVRYWLHYSNLASSFYKQFGGVRKIRDDYEKQIITTLQKNNRVLNKILFYRNLLISKGFTWIFTFKYKGMEIIDNPLERAIITPFKAHIVSDIPTWWLRSISQKSKSF